MTAPGELDAGALALAYARRTLSPVEALRSVLARREAVDPHLNAVIALDPETAEAAARASERRWSRGEALSALDGVPVSVKDNIPVAGQPCRWGSRLWTAHRQPHDELPVRRLRDAGALLFGKTNVPEFTLQGFTDNLLFGATRNPWDLARTPGGSSGGAVAAVAAGIGPAALATDGGGSIRRPCAYTGLAGLKPSEGAVPRSGGLPEMLPGLEVIGPVARCVADVVRILQVIAPTMRFADPASPVLAPPPCPLRIAHWPTIALGPVDPEIARSVATVIGQLRSMGHHVSEAEAPEAVDRFNRRAWPVLGATGLAAVLRDRGAEATLEMTSALATMLAAGRRLSAVDLFDAQVLRRALREAMDNVFETVDMVLTPACAAMPWAFDRSHPETIAGRAVDARGHAVFTAFVNGAGLPALALPGPPSPEGIPIGFQLVGRRGDDARLCALGLDFERRHGPAWHWPTAVSSLLPRSESSSA